MRILDIIKQDQLFIMRKNLVIMTRRYNNELREIGLTAHQLFTLAALIPTLPLHGVTISTTMLANFLGVDRTTVTRGMLILARRGLVTYSSSRRDRRANECMLTYSGKKLVEEGIKVLEGIGNDNR